MHRVSAVVGTATWAMVISAVAVACGGQSAADPPPESPPSASAAPSLSDPAPDTEEATAGVCTSLREAEQVRADSDTPADKAAAFALENDAHTRAQEVGVDPELRDIAEEHLGESDAAAKAMRSWCAENAPEDG